jgi:hypothetical protein
MGCAFWAVLVALDVVAVTVRSVGPTGVPAPCLGIDRYLGIFAVNVRAITRTAPTTSKANQAAFRKKIRKMAGRSGFGNLGNGLGGLLTCEPIRESIRLSL